MKRFAIRIFVLAGFCLVSALPVIWGFSCSKKETPKISGETAKSLGKGAKSRRRKKKKSYVVNGKADSATPAGRWAKRRGGGDARLTAWQQEQLEQLEAIGYVSGSKQAVREGGVALQAPDKVFDGLNFYVSGHAPGAFLMDMKGKILHEWRFEFNKAWAKYPGVVNNVHAQFWRRAYLYDNGDVLAIFEGMGMIKVDRRSKLIWKSARGEHHDLEVMDNGDIYVLTRKSHRVPRVNKKRTIIEDFITILDANGKAKKHISVLECFERSHRYRDIWDSFGKRQGDIFHTNTIEVLDGAVAGKAPEFAKGNILTSMLMLDAIAVIDPEKREVVWAHRGDFKAQHDPQIVESGNLMLFDNQGGGAALGKSRVLEYELPGMSLAWSYKGEKERKFFTKTCGAAQRLPNGNTLVTETDNGRAFEVTRDGKIVWEYFTPHRAGEKSDLVASLFEMKRIPKSRAAWLTRP